MSEKAVYNGVELADSQEPHVEGLPKEMVVWGNMGLGDAEPYVRVIAAIAVDHTGHAWAIAQQPCGGGVSTWAHFAEIPEAPKPRVATNRELSKWLAQGNGEAVTHEGASIIHTYHYYMDGDRDKAVGDYRVRKWGDTEWHEPTVDYMGIGE